MDQILHAIVKSVLRRLFPYRPPPGIHVRPSDELRAEYRWWEALSCLPYLAFVVAIGVLCFLGLQWMVDRHAQTLGPSRFLLMPGPVFSALAAGALGLILASVPTHFLYKALLRDRYPEYTVYCNVKNGFDTWKIFAGMALLLFCVAGVVIAAEMSAYTRITDQAILIRGPLSLRARTHLLSEIESITAVAGVKNRRGEFVSDPYQVVRFKDGSTWSTRDGLQDHRSSQLPSLIAFLAQASGKPIEAVQVLADLKR
jgi:hypothetical protein